MSAPTTELTDAQWAEDVKYLKRQIIERHASVYHTVSKEELDNNFLDLLSNLPKLKTVEKLIRISEIMASIGDAHTWLDIRDTKLSTHQYLPLAFEIFEDGLFVIDATEKYKGIIGRKIIAINDVPATNVISRVGQFGYRENEFTTKFSVPRFLPILEVLQYYKLVDQRDLELEFESNHKATIALSDCQLEPQKYDYASKRSPSFLQTRSRKFWFEEHAKHGLLYIQINECRDDGERTLASFAEEVTRKIESSVYQSVFLDLRNNVGGNAKLVLPIVYALQTFNRKAAGGRLFVATSRSTLSASVVLCNEIKKYCKAYFIGEPTGAKANLYGENSYFITLPNSKLQISFSSEYFQAAGPFNKSNFIVTDVYKPLMSSDLFEGRDPALNFVLDTPDTFFQFEPSFQNAIRDKNYPTAISLANSYANLPENKYLDIEQMIRRAANKLNTEETREIAKQFYELNLKLYPERTLPKLAMADFFFSIKNDKAALSYYNEAKKVIKSDSFLYAAYRYKLEDIIESQLKEIGNRERARIKSN